MKDWSLIESETFSVDVILTDEPVATISISSPADASEAKISIPPLKDWSLIESETFSLEVILTDEPVAIISISSPLDAEDAKISIPPLAEFNTIESLELWFAINIIFPPSPHKFFESFHRNPIPPSFALISIAPFPLAPSIVPSSLIIWIVWFWPVLAWSLIAWFSFSFAFIIALPPSAHKFFELFQCNPIPPSVALR